jgi:perosamine synthetase
VILLTYIYGITYPIEQIVEMCKQRDIEIVEDSAEAYGGNEYTGNPNAVVTMFSFGQIKRCSAFSGSIAFIRDKKLFECMNSINESYPTQDSKLYLKRAIKFLVPYMVANNHFVNYTLLSVTRAFKMDIKELIIAKLRGFNPNDNYLLKFQFKPCAANIAFLHYRLNRFNKLEYASKTKMLQKAVDMLTANGIKCPGYQVKERGFWFEQ